MRNILIVCVLGLLVVTAMPVSAQEVSQDTFVVAGSGLGISCDAEEHPILPTGDPDPLEPTWWTSGEPECAAGDLHNAVREAQGQERLAHGLGSARHLWEPAQDGSLASAALYDELFGTGTAWLTVWAEDPGASDPTVSEGCGPQTIVLPYVIREHVEGLPPTYWWAFVPVVGVRDRKSVV